MTDQHRTALVDYLASVFAHVFADPFHIAFYFSMSTYNRIFWCNVSCLYSLLNAECKPWMPMFCCC